MKSLVSIVNTGAEETIGSIVFSTGIPKVVYRNSGLFSDAENVGRITGYLSSGQFVGYTLSGTANTPEDSIEEVNALFNQANAFKSLPSYSFEYHWNKATCSDMLDGFKKQIDLFDFSGVSVTVPRVEVIRKSDGILTCLSVGYLQDASAEINSLTPDGDDDFLSDAQIWQFIALFNSALAGE